MVVRNSQKLNFQHCVEVPPLDCRVATARDERGKTHIFLIVNNSGPVYRRNGLSSTWDEINDSRECEDIRKHVEELVEHSNIPVFTTRHQPVLN